MNQFFLSEIKPSKDLTLTPLQKFIFDEFSKEKKLTKQFYFTGDTAKKIYCMGLNVCS